MQHNAASSDLCTRPDFHIAKDLGPGADQDTLADLGVSVAAGLAGPTQRDFVQHGDIIFDDSGFSDDY